MNKEREEEMGTAKETGVLLYYEKELTNETEKRNQSS